MDKDMLKEDLKTYRNIETWGTALFLSGIALVGKFVLEIRPDCKVSLPPWSLMVTSYIGLYAFIFLLIVNWRSREARARIDKVDVMPRGWLGWMFAWMPMLFGWAVSYALGTPLLWCLLMVGVVTLFITAYACYYDCKHKYAE